MPQPLLDISGNKDSYLAQTHRPLTALVFLLPMLAFFHIGTAWLDYSPLLAPRDLGRLLELFGSSSAFLPAMLVAVLLTMHLSRREPWKVSPRVLAGMTVESIICMLPLVALCLVTRRSLSAGTGQSRRLFEGLVTAFGAGIYEEFIFRLLFVGGAVLLLVNVGKLRKEPVIIAAIAVAAVCFSLYHFNAEQILAMNLPWRDFFYLMLAGCYLGGLFALRGYAIAAGSHAAFNIFAVWANISQQAGS